MVTIRRWYVFMVCAVSLQAVTWSVILLVRNLIHWKNLEAMSLAFPIAVILIGLPLFLVHWLWAQRLARRDIDERASVSRRLYLYGMLAGFLVPWLTNALSLANRLLELFFGIQANIFLPRTYVITDNIIAMIILALLWFYHQRIVTADASAASETGNAATIRRLYVLGFSAGGLVMVSLGGIRLILWVLNEVWDPTVFVAFNLSGLTSEVARLGIGLPLWLIFWQWAQRLFAETNEDERESTLRKLYLYITVFIAVLSVVISGTGIIAGILRRLLSLESTGDVRQIISVIVGMAVWWAYHAYVLRNDARLVPEAPRQAGIRRLYFYLVAAVGLAASLVGFGGMISVFVRSVADGFTIELKELLTWFAASLVAGLPVWFLPWRQMQGRAVSMTPSGADERQSIVRKIYLYFFLFIATMTVLSGSVYIVTQLLSLFLVGPRRTQVSSDIGQAVAFTFIGLGVWLYHGYALRSDGKINRREQATRMTSLRVTVVDAGEDHFGQEVIDVLRRELPDLAPELIRLPSPGMESGEWDTIQAQLAEAGLIVGPWVVAVTGKVPAVVADAVVCSPARKLLIPTRSGDWEWAGVDRWSAESLVQQTVRAVRQMLDGEEVKVVRPMSIGAILGISIGVLILILVAGRTVIQWIVGF